VEATKTSLRRSHSDSDNGGQFADINYSNPISGLTSASLHRQCYSADNTSHCQAAAAAASECASEMQMNQIRGVSVNMKAPEDISGCKNIAVK